MQIEGKVDQIPDEMKAVHCDKTEEMIAERATATPRMQATGAGSRTEGSNRSGYERSIISICLSYNSNFTLPSPSFLLATSCNSVRRQPNGRTEKKLKMPFTVQTGGKTCPAKYYETALAAMYCGYEYSPYSDNPRITLLCLR